jgi:hemerythrin-like domain-containing protein
MSHILLFPTPAAGFDQPLDLWHACHQRVERMLALLQRLSAHVNERGADEEARNAATSVRRYFDEAAPRHHEDEEADLFPRLLASTHDAEHARLENVIAALREEHRHLDAKWASVRATLVAIERGEAAQFDEALLERFVEGYGAHVDVEEHILGPVLRRVLDAQQLEAIGRAMAERRGAARPS